MYSLLYITNNFHAGTWFSLAVFKWLWVLGPYATVRDMPKKLR